MSLSKIKPHPLGYFAKELQQFKKKARNFKIISIFANGFIKSLPKFTEFYVHPEVIGIYFHKC